MSFIVMDSDGAAGKKVKERRERRRKIREQAGITYSVPRTFNISSLSDGQPKDSLEVPLQAEYTGTHIISSVEASMKPRSVHDLLNKLNEVMGTAHTFERYPELADALRAYIAEGHDFGYTYALLRSEWNPNPVVGLRLLASRAEDDQTQRSNMFDPETNMIVKPFTIPRRVWDLCGNRVIPYWAVSRLDGAISHSWMDNSRRQSIETPINNKEWPVPLLNMGLRTVWLDVLCLRQYGSQENEAIRLQEWKLDVPTIGDVYSASKLVVHYYSGLGRAFRIGDLDSPRHWLNRAWTLQEITAESRVAGIATNSPVVRSTSDINEQTSDIVDPDERKFWHTVSWLYQNCADQRDSLYPILDAMRHRSAESELDKIAGLAYLTMARVYHQAWKALVRAMDAGFRGDSYGSSQSRDKIDATSLPRAQSGHEPAMYYHTGYRFDDCELHGLDIILPDHQKGVACIRMSSGDIYHSLCVYPTRSLSLRHEVHLISASRHLRWLKLTVLEVATSAFIAVQDAIAFESRYKGHLGSHLTRCYYA
ncbi:uncharacterized protein B0H18DRAFT_1064265 [Fomitopsis serialis]|uniref:uncharacterized protein n=1 Tax=Fomitopsis serialis TaxID=139415 RepID=UPI002007F7BF|nr:uncharacterized protein B0H18DRAFT_1064265 [Neoantrodia serialis]KAH9911198.1 hypothetical protein B0H18DRAFT_1064265 [Neoantrodia serialis]